MQKTVAGLWRRAIPTAQHISCRGKQADGEKGAVLRLLGYGGAGVAHTCQTLCSVVSVVGACITVLVVNLVVDVVLLYGVQGVPFTSLDGVDGGEQVVFVGEVGLGRGGGWRRDVGVGGNVGVDGNVGVADAGAEGAIGSAGGKFWLNAAADEHEPGIVIHCGRVHRRCKGIQQGVFGFSDYPCERVHLASEKGSGI